MNTPNGSLQGLIKQAEQLLLLEKQVLNALPSDSRAYCRLLSYRNGTLKLQASDAGWATNIRFQQAQIIILLRRHDNFKEIRQLQIKVRPVFAKQAPQRQPKPISAATAEHLETIAASVDEPRMEAALRNLAKRP